MNATPEMIAAWKKAAQEAEEATVLIESEPAR